MEAYDNEVRRFWTPALYMTAASTTDAAALAVEHLGKIGAAGARIGIEPGFLPADAQAVLAARLDGARFVDATGVLERLRAVKTPAELAELRQGSELITDAMLATIAWAREGTKPRPRSSSGCGARRSGAGCVWDYCLLTLGASHNRAPSDQAWAAGEVLSINSGGNLDGYIGEVWRAWACSASRMRSSMTCWPRSRQCSRRRSPRFGRERPAARSGRGRSR